MNDSQKQQDQVIGQEIVTYQTPPEPGSESTTNLVAGVLRRWYIVLLIFFVVCAVGLPAIWFLIQPEQSVVGAVRVAPILADMLDGTQDPGEISNYLSFMQTQAEMITSDRVVQRAADDLVDRNLSFFEAKGTSLIAKFKQKIGIKKEKPETAQQLKQAIRNGVIVVAAGRNTELIKISMNSTNSEEAKQIVDAFIRAYMQIEVVSATEDENQQLAVLEKERDLLYEKINNDRQAIYQLGKDEGTLALESRTEMKLKRVANLYAILTNVEAERINLEAQVLLLERIKEQPIAPEEILTMRQNYINQDPAVVSFTENITQLEQELIIARQTLATTHPDLPLKVELVETLKAHLEEQKNKASKAFDELVAKETADAGNIQLVTLRSNLAQKKEYEKRLQEILSQVDIEAVGLGRKQLTINELQESQQLSKERYDLLLRRIQDLELQRKRPTRISVHYYADIAEVRDKRVKYMAAIVFGALACGMGLAHLRDKSDKSLRTPDDVAKRIGIRIIGTTTSLHDVKPALLPEQIVGDYQTIRANLGMLGAKGIPKKLVVTSPGMKEGKTTFAVNLATSMAESGKRVLLIDGDLRKPDVARLLNLPKGSRGLQDVLCGVKFEQAVYSVATTGLDVLAADFQDTADAYELLALPSTAKRINMISRKYDHVIIDTPPALVFPDALMWAKIGHAVILVSFAGHTTMPDLKEAKDRLSQINVKVLGTVLSSVQAGHGYYRHGHSYYAQAHRESTRMSRKKLMFSMEENSGDGYSYSQSSRSRKDVGGARKKAALSEDESSDNTESSDSTV